MVLTIGGQLVACVLFGLFSVGGAMLIKGPRSPFAFWTWLGDSFWTACLAWIILYGLIKI